METFDWMQRAGEVLNSRFFNPVVCRLRFNSPPPINQTLARCCAERASWTSSSSLAAAAKPPEMFIPACDLSLDEGSGAVCRRTPAPPLIGRNLTLAHLASMSTVTSSCPSPRAPALYSARPNHVRRTVGPVRAR